MWVLEVQHEIMVLTLYHYAIVNNGECTCRMVMWWSRHVSHAFYSISQGMVVL